MSRLLIVEDSPTQAHQLQLLLGEAFNVQVALDGQSGFDLFKASDFDLVLTDILMPRLSGYELCRKIKDDPAKRHVPVILLTTLNDPVAIVHGIECGADCFIPKPYRPDDLLSRVRGLLANRALRVANRLKVGVEVVFLGKKFTINSEKEQILDLLLSTCEEVVRANRELQASQAELRAAKARVEQHNDRLRNQVRSTEEKYHALMEQANDANFLLDLRGRVLEVNRRAEELLGRTGTDLLGSSFERLVLPGPDRTWFANLLAGGPVRVDGVYVRQANGRVACIDLSASHALVGAERFLLVIARDVTERNRLELQLRQAQKMEAIGRLAGGVAHDFNNLLCIINGYGETILGSLPPDDPLREPIGEITRAGERAAALTRQLLTFSRRSVLAPEVLDLNALVLDLEKLLRRVIGEDIDLGTNLQPTLGSIRADHGQIEQAVLNLVVNARDAMPTGGKLTIETHNVHLDESYCRAHTQVRAGPYVLLAVTDTGCGMSEEVKACLFEPFFTTKAPGKGTGLGLATVFGTVKQSGGHIEVYSESGLGTTFKLYLPRVEGVARAGKSWHSLPPAPRGSETVLVVEDEDAVRTLTRTALEMAGYKVLEASQGLEALRIAAQYDGPIHLLLSDVVMPLLGGRELAEQLLPLHGGMKVLFLSGYTDDAVVRHGVLQEKVNFLQKPFSPLVLTHRVRELLDSPPEGHPDKPL